MLCHYLMAASQTRAVVLKTSLPALHTTLYSTCGYVLYAGLMYGQSQPLMTDPDFKTALKHVLDCLATKGGQMLAQQSGECMGVILAQHHKKTQEGLQVGWGRQPGELEKEVKHILLGVHSKGGHDR